MNRRAALDAKDKANADLTYEDGADAVEAVEFNDGFCMDEAEYDANVASVLTTQSVYRATTTARKSTMRTSIRLR